MPEDKITCKTPFSSSIFISNFVVSSDFKLFIGTVSA
jgi:hypothetical protein